MEGGFNHIQSHIKTFIGILISHTTQNYQVSVLMVVEFLCSGLCYNGQLTAVLKKAYFEIPLLFTLFKECYKYAY